jgi:hypothetical protein
MVARGVLATIDITCKVRAFDVKKWWNQNMR